MDQSHSDARQQSADALSSSLFSVCDARIYNRVGSISWPQSQNPLALYPKKKKKKKGKMSQNENSCITNGHAQTTTGSHKPAENVLRKKKKTCSRSGRYMVTFSSLISDLVHSSSSDEMMLTNKDPFFFCFRWTDGVNGRPSRLSTCV